MNPMIDSKRHPAAMAFRIALFSSALSLAAYIPYKYLTQLHAIEGLYAFLFPLSAALAAGGMLFAARPQAACECAAPVRAGLGAVALLWLATGLLCMPTLVHATMNAPVGGLFATFHMLVQHVFLSLALLVFAVAPRSIVERLQAPALRQSIA